MVFTISSCQKEEIAAKTFTATMEKCKDEQGKTVMTNNVIYWENGDQIKVYGTTGSGVYEAVNHTVGTTTLNVVSGDAGSGPYCAIYPASAERGRNQVWLPVVQATVDGSLKDLPMMAQSDNTQLDFKNLCGILRLRLQKSGVSIMGIEIIANEFISGLFSVNYNNGHPLLSAEGSPQTFQTEEEMKNEPSVMMTCATAQSIATQKDFYIYLPEKVYEGMQIRIYSSDGGVCTKIVRTGSSVRVRRSMITTITLTGNNLDFSPYAGALPGLFTVGQGQQVLFSNGNLLYSPVGTHAGVEGNNMPGTWLFDTRNVYRDGDNGNSYLQSIFYWHSANSPNYPGYFTSGAAFADWGVNSISNGGSQCGQWRTLTSDEWNHLFNSRTDASSKYGAGNVNGVHGMVVLPDNWTLPSGCTFTPGFMPESETDNRWSHNSYTLDQWAEMSRAGAVFLVANGYRMHMKINRFGQNYGYYWASTPSDNESAFCTFFNTSDVDMYTIGRESEISVRLVMDYNISGGNENFIGSSSEFDGNDFSK